jgi:signal transduction histidine kinase
MSSLAPYLPASSRRLAIARMGWVILVLVVLGVIGGGISPYFQQLVQTYNPVFADLGLSPSRYAGYVIGLDLLALLVHLLLAAVLYYRRPRDLMALLVAFTLVSNGVVIPFSLLVRSTNLPPIGTWLVDLIIYFGLISSVTVLYLFPDGRFVPAWTRYLTIGWSLALLPTVLLADSRWDFGNWPFLLQWLLLLSWSGTGAWAQLIRYRNMADSSQKQQAKWAALGLLAAVMAPFVYYLLFVVLPVLEETSVPNLLRQRLGLSFFSAPIYLHFVGITFLRLLTLLFPISLAVAILRYRLWQVDVWINRTVVYGGLTTVILSLYGLTVGLMSSVFQSGNSLVLSALATGLVAILFNPVRHRLQTAVNRLIYGDRDDPITVLTALGRRLEVTAVPAETLPALVETIAQTLKLPYVAIVEAGEQGSGGAGEIITAYPSPLASHPSPFAFPLVYQSETIGQLLVAPRAPGDGFNPAERRLLENVARQAGTAVYAAQLTHDLQRSRERLVTTREEERRRIHRDLHDGLGPQLATLSLKVDAARNYLGHDPATADHLLTELKSEIHSAISDIRRLVHELRPPTLDQLGLVSALREYVVRQNGNGRLHISLNAPDNLPPLPAAVEVAAYRIALEAITNTLRHAQAQTCQLCLQINNGLQLEIRDDGIGLPVGYQAGVGLSSMRERTAELGGTFQIESTPGNGTVILVHLPFASSQ